MTQSPGNLILPHETFTGGPAQLADTSKSPANEGFFVAHSRNSEFAVTFEIWKDARGEWSFYWHDERGVSGVSNLKSEQAAVSKAEALARELKEKGFSVEFQEYAQGSAAGNPLNVSRADALSPDRGSRSESGTASAGSRDNQTGPSASQRVLQDAPATAFDWSAFGGAAAKTIVGGAVVLAALALAPEAALLFSGILVGRAIGSFFDRINEAADAGVHEGAAGRAFVSAVSDRVPLDIVEAYEVWSNESFMRQEMMGAEERSAKAGELLGGIFVSGIGASAKIRSKSRPSWSEAEKAAVSDNMKWWKSPGVTTVSRFARHQQNFHSLAKTLRNADKKLRKTGRKPVFDQLDEKVLETPVDLFIKKNANLKQKWAELKLDARYDSHLREEMRKFLEGKLRGGGGREIGGRRPDIVEFFLDRDEIVITDVTIWKAKLHLFKTEFYVEVLRALTGNGRKPRVYGLDFESTLKSDVFD